MATLKECHTLISYYEKLYREKYNSRPVVNRYSARYGMDAVLMDMSVVEVEELLEYYFTTSGNHGLEYFFYNYDKLREAREATLSDRAQQIQIREETRKRTEEWMARIEQQRAATHQRDTGTEE